MNKDVIKELLYILIAVLLGIMVIKFVIWLLPIILIAVLSYLIYSSMKKNTKEDIDISTNKKHKDRNIKVIHDLDDEDK